jgi:hypothetical protein
MLPPINIVIVITAISMKQYHHFAFWNPAKSNKIFNKATSIAAPYIIAEVPKRANNITKPET